jgi:hypothetical protein
MRHFAVGAALAKIAIRVFGDDAAPRPTPQRRNVGPTKNSLKR